MYFVPPIITLDDVRLPCDLFFLLNLYYFYLGIEKEEGRRKYYLLAGLFMGLGVLTKGPLVYLSLPIFFIFTLFQKNLKKFWCRDLLWGVLLSAIIALVWWIPACWIGGKDYIHWLLFKQAIGTYMEGGNIFIQSRFISTLFVSLPNSFHGSFFCPLPLFLGYGRSLVKGRNSYFSPSGSFPSSFFSPSP